MYGTEKGNDVYELPTYFADRTFVYEQVCRQGRLALYCQTHKVAAVQRYEVVRIRIRAAHTWPNGSQTPEHEAYPSPESWGRDGWTFYTQEAATKHMTALAIAQAFSALREVEEASRQ